MPKTGYTYSTSLMPDVYSLMNGIIKKETQAPQTVPKTIVINSIEL